MPFDNTSAADLTALKNELTTDPIGMGYNLNGSKSKVVKQLTDPGLNVGGDVIARPFTVASMFEALDPADFQANQTNTKAAEYTHILVEYGSAGYSIEPYKTKWGAMFAGNSTTKTALDAQTQPISRADVLFGDGSRITENDIALALAV